MESNFKKNLDKIRPNKLSPKEKDAMWSNIGGAITTPKTAISNYILKIFIIPFSVAKLISRKMTLAAALIIALIVGSISTTVAFADHSSPGDFLFPVDVAAENILLTITFGDTENTLRLKFAEERLDEVKELLALAESVEIDDGSTSSTESENATSTESQDDSQDSSNNNNSEDESTEATTEIEDAIAIALEHLNSSKSSFEEDGNSLGAQIIDSIISDLTSITEDHLGDFDKVKIVFEDKKGDDKIKISVSSGDLKFKFEEKTKKNGDVEQKVEIKENGQKTKLSIKGEDIKFELKTDKDSGKEKGKHDDDERGKGKGKNDKVVVCHKGKDTKFISEKSLKGHLQHGDSEGRCDRTDDDEDEDQDDTLAPTITNITSDATITSATITWDTSEVATSITWYSTSSLFALESPTEHVFSTNLTQNHSLAIDNLTASTTYYYVVESADEAGNAATSSVQSFETAQEEDTIPPVISDINTSEISTSSVKIAWTTDEPAKSILWYEEFPLQISTTTSNIVSADLKLVHENQLFDLKASTTYSFVIVVEDEAGNVATSSLSSFTTNAEIEIDLDPPIISSVEATSINATSTTIVWTTDEPASSRLWYGESPFMISSSTNFIDTSIHSLEHNNKLMDLFASTTYGYMIIAEDEAGNVASSTEMSFLTTD